MKDPYGKSLNQRGFTIVELLIVIVIIGILATLVIVAYNGITARANDTAIQTDLRNISQKSELFYADYGRYPMNSGEVATLVLRVQKLAYQNSAAGASNNLLYCFSTNGSVYSVVAASASKSRYYINSNMKTPTPTSQALAGMSGAVVCPATGASPVGAWLWLYNGGAWTGYVAT